MDEKYLDVYTLFKMQCKDGDILSAYYPFLANIIIEKQMEEISEDTIKIAFEEKYEIPISVPFIRQVLGIGVSNNSIVKRYGKYIADITE